MTNLKRIAVAALVSIMVMACSGQMSGVVRRDAKRIDIMFTDSRLASAELVTVMPNGERFSGKSESYDKKKEMMSAESTVTDEVAIHFEDLQTFPANAKATLYSDRGNMIECRFKLTDVIIGFSSGGVGLCQVSDGRVIDVFF
ncbi:MAG: hypothetical protein QNJ58_17925 [Desulfobacterales bacterium]|nr:hypothetical protein [Desulfobacterales bacterium]